MIYIWNKKNTVQVQLLLFKQCGDRHAKGTGRLQTRVQCRFLSILSVLHIENGSIPLPNTFH